MHHYLYRQVNYDIIILPYPILSDYSYENDIQDFYVKDIDYGYAKGRSTLDKMGMYIYLDYSNLNHQENFQKMKYGILAFLLNLPISLVNQFYSNSCLECKNYGELRKKILEIYYANHKGLAKQFCSQKEDIFGKYLNHNFQQKWENCYRNIFRKNLEALKKIVFNF